MSLYGSAKQLIKSNFRKVGLDIRRVLLLIGLRVTRAKPDESEDDESFPPLLGFT